ASNKTFRNGIIGTSTLTQGISTSPFLISGSTASIGGTGTIALISGGLLPINSPTVASLTSAKTITGGTFVIASGATVTMAGFINTTFFTAAAGVVTVTTNTAATPTVAITGNTTPYTYTGSVQGPTTASNTGTGTVTFSYSGTPNSGTFTTGAIRPANAGSYSVTATAALSADGNWAAASSSPSSYSINRATPAVAVTGNTTPYTYTGSLQRPSSELNTGTGTVTFSYSGTPNSGSFTTGSARPANAGSYSVTATAALSADGNWAAASS